MVSTNFVGFSENPAAPALTAAALRDAFTLCAGLSTHIDISSNFVQILGAQSPATLESIGQNLFITPEQFYETGDAGDDAPSIQRAINWLATNGLTNLYLLSRTYYLQSAIVQNNQFVNWIGQGWSETKGTAGTWFHISDPSFNPITWQGDCRMSRMSGIGVYQDQPTPASGWAPTNYPPVLTIQNMYGGCYLNNLFFLAVTNAISVVNCGRLVIDDIYGHVFTNMLTMDNVQDSCMIGKMRNWPYFGANQYYMQWQQANCDMVRLYRCDGSDFGYLFCFAGRSVVRLSQSSNGVPTANTFRNVQADHIQWWFWVDSSVQSYGNVGDEGITIFIDNLLGGSQAFNGADGVTPSATTLPLSNGLRIDGVAQVSIGKMAGNFIAQYFVYLSSSGNPSWVSIGQIEPNFTQSLTPAYCYVENATGSFPGGGQYHRIFMGGIPLPGNSITAVPLKNSNGTGGAPSTGIVNMPGLSIDQSYITPDLFKIPSDGSDDAPSIQRAIQFVQSHGMRKVNLLGRTYLLASAISIGGGFGFELEGAGCSEVALQAGTWLHIQSASFQPFYLAGLDGFKMSGIGVAQDHSTTFASGWAPTVYPPVFNIFTCNRADISSIHMPGIYQGFEFTICPRLTLRDITGQFFSYMYQIDQTYDKTYFDNLEAWPFWANNQYVNSYCLQNADIAYFLRCDTPFMGNIFGDNCRSVVRLGQSAGGGNSSTPGGIATAGTFQNINGDTVEHAIWVDSTVQVTENVGENGAWMNVGTVTCGCGVDPINGFSRANAAPILVDGVANILVNQTMANVFPLCVAKMTGTGTPSQVTLQRTAIEFSEADTTNRCLFYMANASGSWPGDTTGLKHIGRVNDVNPGNKGTAAKNAGSTGTVYIQTETSVTTI